MYLPQITTLIRFVPESARNNGGKTKHALFDARCPSGEPTLATKCHRGGKNRGPTRTRTQGLSLTMRGLCQLSYRATWSSYDIFHVDITVVIRINENDTPSMPPRENSKARDGKEKRKKSHEVR